ncbi:fructokinase [Erythromicrobium ramosum]|uniref:fructokinase n=1 Tax=Erythrobacter ramosus TaxID=35811 RepID=A0A6I4ULP6_9SPHN|nr:ROK family protein [Erythrobacter ramosus]MBB3776703.1 fructokinase [Erythrobacter ramosus]MXP39558.1 ROK family protein [Erythrobacter ramosus]
MLGAIEAGGTKFVLAVGPSPERITARHTIPTRDPETTLAEAAEWLAGQGGITALGIGSFGPVELGRTSPRWGFITTTPKPGWADCDIAGYFGGVLGVPVGFDTDVNAAALAEHAASGSAGGSLAYLTVGTGIGGGLVLDGQPVHGIAHPEVGHIYPRRHPEDRDFPGTCPSHGDCLEGLASGPAIMARWGMSLSHLPADHPGHAIIAECIAQACHVLFASVAVEDVVVGGGVANTPGLVERVAQRARELDAGYLPGTARHRVIRPRLGSEAGITGAMMLADGAAKA